jgi:carboxyl-terminal processing protease
MKKNFKTTALLIFSTVAIIILSGFILFGEGADFYYNTNRSITIFGQVYREIAFNYVDEINPEQFMRAGIKGMLGTLDPYTVFFDEEDNKALRVVTTGKYGGVGLEIDLGASGKDRTITVIAPMDDSPAAKAGIMPGDKIIEIDGEPTINLAPDKVSAKLRGEVGTQVTITIQREGEKEPIKYTLTRAEIIVKDVSYYGFISNDIAYIKLSHFSNKAVKELERAIKELTKEKLMKGLILDLRDNPGGLLESAVDITNLFVDKGLLVVSTKGRNERANNNYYSNSEPILKDVPLVVFVNGGSASASEVVAGAIQDLDRGVIIGEKTFGKGLVQTVTALGRDAALKITTARYYTPSGRCIQKIDYSKKLNINLEEDEVDTTTQNSKVEDFKTKKGRIVHSGGGIEPDIEIKQKEQSRFERDLIRKGIFFGFAVSYAAKHKEINGNQFNPKNFSVDEAILNEFKQYLKDKNFSYITEGEQELSSLIKIASTKNLRQDVVSKLKEVEKIIELEKEKDFEISKEFLKIKIAEELGARYHGTKGRIDVKINNDEYVKESSRILGSTQEYRKILKIESK